MTEVFELAVKAENRLNEHIQLCFNTDAKSGYIQIDWDRNYEFSSLEELKQILTSFSM
jgi:hypothetical protein